MKLAIRLGGGGTDRQEPRQVCSQCKQRLAMWYFEPPVCAVCWFGMETQAQRQAVKDSLRREWREGYEGAASVLHVFSGVGVRCVGAPVPRVWVLGAVVLVA